MSNESNEMDFESDMFGALHTSTPIQAPSAAAKSPGHAFVSKCLHPPLDTPMYAGLPTNDARSQVCLDYRNLQIMSSPLIQDSAGGTIIVPTATQLSTFNIAMLCTNGLRVQSIAFINNATDGNILKQDFANNMIQDLYAAENLIRDATLYRPVYKSTSVYPNMTMFNNTGVAASCQFNPNILFAGTVLNFAHTQPDKFYQFVASGIKDKRINKRINPTREHIEAWETFPHYHRAEVIKNNNLQHSDVLDLDPNLAIQVVVMGDSGDAASVQTVPTLSQMMTMSSRSYAGKATEGVFSVQRLNTIAPKWLTSGNTSRTTGQPQTWGLYECYKYLPYALGGVFEPFLENAPAGTPNTALVTLRDTLWSSDMTWSWIAFFGLTPNNSAGATINQMVIKKVYTGYEVQAAPLSAFSGLMKLAPKPDLAAMQAMMDAFYELKDAFPVKYNFLGTLASLAAKGIRTFGTSLLKELVGGSPTKKKPNKKPNKVKQPANKVVRENKQELSQLASVNKKLDQMSMGGYKPRGGYGRRNRGNRNMGVPMNQYINSKRTPLPQRPKNHMRNPNAPTTSRDA
jgi:hypothetical protein